MKLLKNLSTGELKKEIEEKVKKINGENYDIIYENYKVNNRDGIYVFSDSQGYHYVVSERGNAIIHKVTDDLFEITFWTVYPIVVGISFDYEVEHREHEDPRIIAFSKQLELLGKIGSNFVKRGEIEQSEILEINPIEFT